MMVKFRCRVTGRVQGVWYRATTQRKAQELGVTGHAYNMPDGAVEVLACGSAEAVAALREWLRQGPPSAKVEEVECEAADEPVPESFRIG
jgi:acylphosphatase